MKSRALRDFRQKLLLHVSFWKTDVKWMFKVVE